MPRGKAAHLVRQRAIDLGAGGRDRSPPRCRPAPRPRACRRDRPDASRQVHEARRTAPAGPSAEGVPVRLPDAGGLGRLAGSSRRSATSAWTWPAQERRGCQTERAAARDSVPRTPHDLPSRTLAEKTLLGRVPDVTSFPDAQPQDPSRKTRNHRRPGVIGDEASGLRWGAALSRPDRRGGGRDRRRRAWTR